MNSRAGVHVASGQRHWRQILLSLVLGASACWQAVAAPDAFEIVRSGETTPSGDGRYGSFLEPSVNTVGALMFKARLIDTDGANMDDSGIYRIFTSELALAPSILTLQEVIREGETYNIGGGSYAIADVFLTRVRLEDAPAVDMAVGQFSALAARLPVTSGNLNGNTIIAVEDAQLNWQLVVAAGDDVPNGNGTFREISNNALSDISRAGGVNFFASLEGTSGGSADNAGLYQYRAGVNLVEIVRKGNAAAGGVFTSVGGLRSNDAGGVAFVTVNSAGSPGSDTTLFRTSGVSQGLIRVVGEGDTAPSDDIDPRVFSAITEHRLNISGEVGFAGRLRDSSSGFAVQNGSGLYVAPAGAGSITQIVREGQLTPDGSARYGRFASSSGGNLPRSPFNNLAQFAFVVGTNLADGSGPSSGLFLASEGQVKQIAVEGDAFEGGTFLGFRRDPALNNRGLVVFDVELNVGMGVGDEGPFVITNQVLVLTNGEDYAVIARESEQIGSRTIREIIFNNDPTGPANGLNDNGKVAFEVLYEDGSSAIALWRPELVWQAPLGDGSWDEPGNWFFGIPPNIDSRVTINTDMDSSVSGPAADTAVHTLALGHGPGQVTLALNGGIVNTEAGTTIGPNGTIVVADNTTATLAGNVTNSGEIQLGAGSRLTLAGTCSGSGVIAGAGSTVVFLGAVSPGAGAD